MRTGPGALILGGSLLVAACHRPPSPPNTAPAGEKVAVSIREVRASLESVPYRLVALDLVNRSDHSVIVDGYQIAWPGGRFAASGLALRLVPGATISRTARIDQGTLENLTVKSAFVTLLSVRDAR